MSAIWGVIPLKEQSDDTDGFAKMDESMRQYRIDRIDHVLRDGVYFACGHQHITPEAKNEVLPFFDRDRNILFTADCILDNRTELLEKLKEENSSVSDGALAYKAFCAWGDDFVKNLRGVFSFAVYKFETKTLLLYTDQLGCRMLNYIVKDDKLVFSTAYAPILEYFGKENVPVCEKWVTACEAEPSACMIIFPGLTPYEDVRQVEPATILTLGNGEKKAEKYWSTEKRVKKLKGRTDDEYRELFVSTFRACVEDALRPGTKVAATLSSGLDSSSVVCLAAKALEKRGERINTYTSVPEEGYVSDKSIHDIVDESPYVKKTISCFNNIDGHFVNAHNKTAFTDVAKKVEKYGFPVKSLINMVWLDDVYEDAGKRGCTVALSGQFGNITVSYGGVLWATYRRMCSGHFIRAVKEVKKLSKRVPLNKRVFVKLYLKGLSDRLKIRFGSYCSGLYAESPVHEELLKKHKIREAQEKNFRLEGEDLKSSKQRRYIMSWAAQMQQMGMYDTMISLMYGIIERDPTKDVRMIELCMQLPDECYMKDGRERRLIREYMKGIVPEHVLNLENKRGSQSADFMYRLNLHLSDVSAAIENAMKSEELKRYIKTESISSILELTNRKKLEPADRIPAIYATYLASLSCFLEMNKTKEPHT